METPKYIIRIPDPCHEDWNKMTPDDKGKFCNSCCKSVVDFTNKTDQEIIDILQSAGEGKVCGHFRKSQVDRPLQLKVNLRALPKNMNATRMFAIALLMVFGSVLVSCYDHKNEKISNIEVIEQRANEENMGTTGLSIIMPPPVASAAENTVTIEEIFVHNEVMGDVSYECTAIEPPMGQAFIEPLPEYVEYIKGKVKSTRTDSVPKVVDSTSTMQRLTGEIKMIMPEKIKTADSTKTAQKDSSATMQKKIEYAYLGAPVLKIGKYTPVTDSSKISSASNNEKPAIKDNIEKENLFVVYPNPSKGEFTLKYEVLKRMDVRVDLLTENGSLVRTIVNVAGQHEGKYQIPVNVTDLPNGTYLLTKMSGGMKETKRVILEK
jgi:hypothetical protein